MRVHHVGVATRDAASLAKRYEALLEATTVHEERFDGMEVVFLDLDGQYLELLEPRADGVIDRFLDERGPGVHHVAYETDDVEGALERARDLGVERIDESPRPGAWGHEVAFLHPNSTDGVLIEFVEVT